MDELLKKAARLLYDVENFGGDSAELRSKISLWLNEYEAAQHSVHPTLLESEPIYDLKGKIVKSGKIVFDKPQSG